MAKLVAKKQDSNVVVLQIDPDRLDEHWVEQPGLMYRYMKLSAELRQTVENAKTATELRAVEVAAKVRERPSKFGLEKVTEGAVKEAVMADKEYQSLCNDMQNARFELDLTLAVVNSLEHKKRALENLVTLHGQGYFASPRANAEVRDEMQELDKRFSRTKGRKRSE